MWPVAAAAIAMGATTVTLVVALMVLLGRALQRGEEALDERAARQAAEKLRDQAVVQLSDAEAQLRAAQARATVLTDENARLLAEGQRLAQEKLHAATGDDLAAASVLVLGDASPPHGPAGPAPARGAGGASAVPAAPAPRRG